jgi:hypothetical protein
MTSEVISNLRRKKDYYASDAPDWMKVIWPRNNGFDWFLKNNRQELVSLGGLIRLGRDYFINVTVFPSVALKILGFIEDQDGTSGNSR